MKLLAIRRLFRIQRVVIRYRLDDLLFALPLPWWMLSLRYALPWRWFPRKKLELSRGAALRLALQDLGPIFIKFGQILSTRRDLVPPSRTASVPTRSRRPGCGPRATRTDTRTGGTTGHQQRWGS